MAAKTQADDSTEIETEDVRPALLLTEQDEAADALTMEMTRDEMRQACRDWDVSGYGDATKAEMGTLIMEQAGEDAIGFLAESGYDIQGALAADYGLADTEDEQEEQETHTCAGTTADGDPCQQQVSEAGAYCTWHEPVAPEDSEDDADDEAEAEQEQDAEAEDEGEQDRQTVQDVLLRAPSEHYNTSDLSGTEKQVAALRAAFEDPSRTEDEAAEEAGCTGRYVYDTCARFNPDAEGWDHISSDLDVPQEVQG